jgi:hypothetical protein
MGMIGPTVYEIQILTNQVTIMGALAVLMPDKGEDQILENMVACAVNTQMLLTGTTGVPPKEEKA